MTAQPSHHRHHVPQVSQERWNEWRRVVAEAARRKIERSNSRFNGQAPVPTVNVDQHGGDCSGGDDES